MVQMIFSAPGEQPLPAVAWNYEEVKAEVEASLAQYKDRAYTPETIGGAKADRAALNKLADVLAAKRREVKAQYLAPYENFERQCKEVEGMIAAASKAIDAQVKEFEGVEKERKRGTIIEIYQSIAGELVAMVPPAAVWNPKWLNKTYSIDAIRMELEATVQRIHESMLDVAALKASKDRTSDIKTALDALVKDKAWAFDAAPGGYPNVKDGGEAAARGKGGMVDGVEAAFASMNPNLKV